MNVKNIGFGALFGFVLSRTGATDYDAIHGMFRLSDLHLFGVIGTAIAVSALAYALVRRFGLRTISGEPITLTKKPVTRGLVAGSLLFGVGWALAGTCPGTALAQIGEGRLAALATAAGILVGAFLAERVGVTRSRLNPLSSPAS
jgi:hypothetical protein